MAETLILDSSDIATGGRISFDITAIVAQAGPDWGDAAIEQYLADAQQGALPVDYRVPNRTITIPLLLRDIGATRFEDYRARLQQKAALFQREGGWLKRTTAVGAVFADIVGASLKFGGSTLQALWDIDADAVLTLVCLPDWYGPEETYAARASSAGQAEFITVLPGIGGHHPARARITITELDSKRLRGLIWGVRVRNYSGAATARLAIEAEAMTALSSVSDVPSGASGGSALRNNVSLTPTWLPLLRTDLTSGGALTHVGSYRVWARVGAFLASGLSSLPEVRLVWDVGDLTNPVENAPAQLPQMPTGALGWYLLDLGEIRLDPAPVGTHRWQGVIQARTATPQGDDVYIDKIWLQPLDEAAGQLIAPTVPTVGLSTYSARDGFDQAAGALTGKTLPVGGTWTFLAGDTDDFTVNASHQAQRATAADTAARFVYASTPTLTNLVAQIDLLHPDVAFGGGEQITAYLLFRSVDASNYGYVELLEDNAGLLLRVGQKIAGTPTILRYITPPDPTGIWKTMRVMATDGGDVLVWLMGQDAVSADPLIVLSGLAAFKTGGTLASGKVGFGEYATRASSTTYLFDNFAAWVPDIDAVCYPSRICELRHDSMIREAVGGTNYGPATVIGDHVRLPPAGLEGRDCELLLKGSEGDLDELSDASISRLNVQVRYRPTYLFVPESLPGS